MDTSTWVSTADWSSLHWQTVAIWLSHKHSRSNSEVWCCAALSCIALPFDELQCTAMKCVMWDIFSITFGCNYFGCVTFLLRSTVSSCLFLQRYTILMQELISYYSYSLILPFLPQPPYNPYLIHWLSHQIRITCRASWHWKNRNHQRSRKVPCIALLCDQLWRRIGLQGNGQHFLRTSASGRMVRTSICMYVHTCSIIQYC